MASPHLYTAFEQGRVLYRGTLDQVIIKTKKRLGKADNCHILIFSDSTGKLFDFNFQGSERELLKRLEVYIGSKDSIESQGPGRPKLGVVSREISLLPRHWEWLATQSGGASATIRRLIEEARKKEGTQVSIKQAQDRTYKFMSVIAGDLNGFEEALRALYKRDLEKFRIHIESWPKDVRQHTFELSQAVFT